MVQVPFNAFFIFLYPTPLTPVPYSTQQEAAFYIAGPRYATSEAMAHSRNVVTTKLLRMSATYIQATDLIFDGTVGYKNKIKSASFKYTHYILDGYSNLLKL